MEINTQPLAPITPKTSSLLGTRAEHKAFTVSLQLLTLSLTYIYVALFIEDINPKSNLIKDSLQYRNHFKIGDK